jgi:hypothetical protein
MIEFKETNAVQSQNLVDVTVKQEKQVTESSIAVVGDISKYTSPFEEYQDILRREELAPFIKIEGREEGVKFYSNWTRFKRMTAKVIEIGEDRVTLECLIDRENKIYKKKIFAKHLLENVDLVEGKRLLFNYYKRDKEFKITIFDNQNLIPESDFPTIDFSQYKNDDFFKED